MIYGTNITLMTLDDGVSTSLEKKENSSTESSSEGRAYSSNGMVSNVKAISHNYLFYIISSLIRSLGRAKMGNIHLRRLKIN